MPRKTKSQTKPDSAVSSQSEAKSRKARISQTDVPAFSLAQAIRVPQAIFDQYGGREVTPLQLAKALEMTPASSSFRMLAGASIAYGLTEGGYNAEKIKVTDLASRIIKPKEEGQDEAARKEALLKPRVIGTFLNHYDGSAFPRQDIALNVLEGYGVPPDRSIEVLDSIIEGARTCGVITQIRNKDYVSINIGESSGAASEMSNLKDGEHEAEKGNNAPLNNFEEAIDPPGQPSHHENKKIFITHGKNKSLIEPIKKLLAFGELQPVVSVESSSVARPVPDKVMKDMRSCSGAIIHVDAERELLDNLGNVCTIMNENVLIEIGAAMALYGRRFILLVKDGIKLPSNLQGLFEVRYTADDLGADKTIELLDAINKLKKEPIVKLQDI